MKTKKEAEKREPEKHVQSVVRLELPSDWKNVFDNDKRAEDVHADSVSDALILSLTNLGKVDIEYMASIAEKDCKTVISSLRGAIYQNPETWGECFYKGWETSDEYLSGNLKYKLDKAVEASACYNGYFDENIKVLKTLLPPLANSKDIYVTLGSPWLPTDVIDDFIEYLLGKLPRWYDFKREQFRVRHDEVTGSWEIPYKERYGRKTSVISTYGTDYMGALHIIEKTLNMKTLTVSKEVVYAGSNPGRRRIIDKERTLKVEEKQQKIIDEFQKWVWHDKDRKKRLEKIFTDKYCSIRTRVFDGSFLTFPTLSEDVTLPHYERNAVARIIFSPNTLLAHDVGSGKTYEMIAAGQEMLRMGLSKRNMYVIPNNIMGQWETTFREMYPDAHPLCITSENFKPKKRADILAAIKKHDTVIITYSCFGMIPLSKSFRKKELNAKKNEIDRLLKDKTKMTANLRQKSKTISEALERIEKEPDNSDHGMCFDELGITRLFIDEAHNFKNLTFETKLKSVMGISVKGSEKCQDMLDKVHSVQKNNNGRGVIFATGTPITNSITDIYAMQQYLQSGELNILGIQSFDSWLGMFSERETAFEIDVDTSNYRMATRLSKFHNLPELSSLLAQIADFHRVDKTAGIPVHDGYKDCVIQKTPEFEAYLKDISYRVDAIRNRMVSRTEDNMLKVTVDGRKAALDMRLVDPSLSFSINSKVQSCAENIYEIYQKTQNERSTQIVFCDVSTPKDNFNIYDELKRLLMNFGIPGDEIQFIHNAQKEKEKTKLFKKVRGGEVRVIIGSTFKLGLGVNIQERLIALHHIDVPWRPADMVQREGRILRQGNTNKNVEIYRYITDGSFDAYSWQLLETKQKFIDSLLSGFNTERSGNDVSDTVLDYAEVKALAIGNPLIKKRVETSNELNRLISLQMSTKIEKLRLENELKAFPAKIQEKKTFNENCSLDNDFINCLNEKNRIEKVSAKAATERRNAVRDCLNEGLASHVMNIYEKKLMSYRGFDVILPSNMDKDKPYIFLSHAGRYRVNLGNSVVGNLMRIDNFLDGFAEFCSKNVSELETLIRDMQETELALKSMQNGYSDRIEKQRKKLNRLDKKLGVGANV